MSITVTTPRQGYLFQIPVMVDDMRQAVRLSFLLKRSGQFDFEFELRPWCMGLLKVIWTEENENLVAYFYVWAQDRAAAASVVNNIVSQVPAEEKENETEETT